MQFQVPQFIDTEDKIIGPLSLRQFAFVGIGGVLSAILYLIAQPWLWALGSFFIFTIAIAFAFVKIQGRPFLNIAIAAFNFYWKPQTYVWQPETRPVVHAAPKSVATEANESALEDILSRSAMAHKRAVIVPAAKPAPALPRTQTTPTTTPAVPAEPVAPIKIKPEPEPKHEVKPETKPVALAEPHRETQPESAAAAAIAASSAAASALISRAAVSIGSALHKSWENVQTGASFAKKNSDRQFLDRKMAERYQIFQKVSGDRHAARRIDYR